MKKKNLEIIPNNSFTELLLYTTPNGKVKVEIFLRDESIWLTQARIGELFGVDRTVVTKHLQNIYSDRELCKKSTSAKVARVRFVLYGSVLYKYWLGKFYLLMRQSPIFQ